jgi:Alpha-L-arabinofuranosidase B, catalytic
MAANPRTRRLTRWCHRALVMAAGLAVVAGLACAVPARPASAASSGPCDIYASYGTSCVAAYSTTRALYASYDGPLYQVQRASDGAKGNIGLLSAGGDVNAAGQDSFCANTSCTVTELYDQSPEGNNLTVGGAGGAAGADHGAPATALPITINGNRAYGLDIMGHTGYRDDSTRGIAVNGAAEGMYMVADGTHVNSGCCFDFGNAETNNDDNGNGHMDAVNLGTGCFFGPCAGSGPWVRADMENGLFAGGNGADPGNLGNSSPFVTAMLKNNGQTSYALKGGNAQSGGLSTWYEGPLPDTGGYTPMHQEGAIILGIGGDNSNASIGTFYEGVMTSGYPSDAADNAVQANITAAGYSELPAATAGPAVVHDQYTSVYTLDAASDHLQETYLPQMGGPWHTQDLSANYGTPAVMAGTEPVALTHDGYTSVYTVDAGSGDLQETYLPQMGGPWHTQNLSAEFGTPPTSVTPTAVYHTGFTSVYTADASNGHLQETYLPAIGDGWSTQDLSANYGTPAVLGRTSPVAVLHSGYTSVYTVDASSDHLQETYLPVMGGPWSTQDLSGSYGTPATSATPAAVVHAGFTSVYTVDGSSDHLQETYLPAIGDPWTTQDLSASYGTPLVAAGTQPVALYHAGFTSVYTVDGSSDHLQETYLPAIGDPWTTQDLSANYGTPATTQTPIALLHPDASDNLTWTSVYTVDAASDHLQETYLPAIGDPWTTQDLSAGYGTPPA